MKKIILSIYTLLFVFVLGLYLQPTIFATNIEEIDIEVKFTFIFDETNTNSVQPKNYTYGTTFNITSELTDNYVFVTWVMNGIVRSDIPENHKFRATNNLNIVGIYRSDDTSVTIYLDSNGELLKYVYLEDALQESLPPVFDDSETPLEGSIKTPSKPGYKVNESNSWKLIYQDDDNNEIYKLQYELTDPNDEVVILVDNVEHTYQYNELVTLNAPEGMVFAENGKIISQDNNYIFTALRSREIYTIEDEISTPTIILSKDLKLRDGYSSFLGQFSLPEGYEIVEVGLIGTQTLDEDLTLTTDNVVIIPSNSIHNVTNEFLRSIEDDNVSFIRAYLITDYGGSLDIFYTDIQYLNLELYKTNKLALLEEVTEIQLYEITSNSMTDVHITLNNLNLKDNVNISSLYNSIKTDILNSETTTEIDDVLNENLDDLYNLTVLEYLALATTNIKNIIDDIKGTLSELFDGYVDDGKEPQITLNYLENISHYQWWTPDQYKVSEIYNRIIIENKDTKEDVFTTYNNYYSDMIRSVMNRTIYTVYHMLKKGDFNNDSVYWNVVVSFNAGASAESNHVYYGNIPDFIDTKIGVTEDFRLWGWAYHDDDRVDSLSELLNKYNFDVSQLLN